MKILSFDTSLDKMYVALSDDEKILSSKIVETTQSHYHSAFLISTIKTILKENDLTPNDINVIATNIGPGSFTGIRACTTVARVFAQAKNIKLVGVSSLEIISNNRDCIVALDARKEMAYVAAFKEGKTIIEPKAIKIDELKEIIEENNLEIITDNKLEEILQGKSYQKLDEDLGISLIKAAYKKLAQNCETNWQKLHPLYIQPPPVTIKKAS